MVPIKLEKKQEYAFLKEGIEGVCDHISVCLTLNQASSYIEAPLKAGDKVYLGKVSNISNKKLKEASAHFGWKLTNNLEEADYYVMKKSHLESFYDVYDGIFWESPQQKAKLINKGLVEVRMQNNPILSMFGKWSYDPTRVSLDEPFLLINEVNGTVQAYEKTFPSSIRQNPKDLPDLYFGQQDLKSYFKSYSKETARWVSGIVLCSKDYSFLETLNHVYALRTRIEQGKTKILVSEGHASSFNLVLAQGTTHEFTDEHALNIFEMLCSEDESTLKLGLTLLTSFKPSIKTALVLAYAYNHGKGFNLTNYKTYNLNPLKDKLRLFSINWKPYSNNYPYWFLQSLHDHKNELRDNGIDIDKCAMFKKVFLSGLKAHLRTPERAVLLDYLTK